METKFIESDEKTISDIIMYMKQCPVIEREFFSKIIMHLRLCLISSVTNEVSERSVTAKKRLEAAINLAVYFKQYILQNML